MEKELNFNISGPIKEMEEFSLISIRKAATELERLEEFGRSAVSCYSEAIGSAEKHAIDLGAEQVAHFRSGLRALISRLREVADTQQLKDVQRSFDAELRDYQEWARKQIEQLRRDVAAAAAAIEAMTSSLNESESGLELDVKRELEHLNRAATGEDINEMRGAIRSATEKITTSVQQLRASNQLAVAQLKDEIRVLHQEIQGMRRVQSKEQEEQVASRQHVSGRMDELCRQGKPFLVLLAVVKNLEGLQNCHPTAVIESSLRDFEQRFASLLPDSAMIGRWKKNQFAAVLDSEGANCMDLSRDLARKLSTPVLEETRGVTHAVMFNVATGVMEFRPGSDRQKFQAKLTELADALAG